MKPASLNDSTFKATKQAYATAFSLYQVTNGTAAEFECDPENAYEDFDKARLSKTAGTYGNYFVSAFRLNAPQGKSDPITLLWTKEGKYWKVVAWEFEPEEAKPRATPDTRRRKSAVAATAPKTYANADADFLRASQDFLQSWLVADNFDHAATYFSPRADECVTAYLAEGEQPPSTPEQYAAYIRTSITSVGKDVGTVQRLSDALEPVRPDHDDLQLVHHADEDAYTAIAVPDGLAESFSCQKESPRHPYTPASDPAQQKAYGNYYATLFALRTPGDHAAALTLLWNRESAGWKIIAYEVIAP